MTKKPQGKRKKERIKVILKDGRLEIVGHGKWYTYWRDPYHLLLTISWIQFMVMIAIAYLAINAFFALAYLVEGDGIANATPGSFFDAFFFSVQTLASIGYGAMYPKSFYANVLVTIEAMISIVGIAVMTGLAFARFSRPTARVMFSNVAVIAPMEGVPTLIVRTANRRRNYIVEAQVRMMLMRDETTSEGEFMRRFYDLKLVRNWTPSFSLGWNLMHPITETSPLWKATPESLREMNATIVVSMTGMDETVSQNVHARHSYSALEVIFHHRFVDVFHNNPDGTTYIDYEYFHDVFPIN